MLLRDFALLLSLVPRLLLQAALLVLDSIFVLLQFSVALLHFLLEGVQLGLLLAPLCLEGLLGLLERVPLLHILWLFVSIRRDLTLQVSFQQLLSLDVRCFPLRLFLAQILLVLLLPLSGGIKGLLARVERRLQLLQ